MKLASSTPLPALRATSARNIWRVSLSSGLFHATVGTTITFTGVTSGAMFVVVASRGYSASPSSGLVEESNAITFSVRDAVHVGSPAAETVGPMAGFSGIAVLASEIVATLALVGAER